MILNTIDIGAGRDDPAAAVGQAMGSALVTGSRTIAYSTGGMLVKQSLSFWVTAWQSLGGAAAGSTQALRYLIQQLEELGSNPDLQPVYVQFRATANPAEASAADLHDGWYLLDNLTPDPSSYVPGKVKVGGIATLVAPASPSALASAYAGGALSSGYSAAAVPLIAFPVGATGQPPTTGSRTGGEGAIPLSTSPVVNPVPWIPSATLANLWKGGCHVYDTVTPGGNAVPVAGGTFLNANWVEVFGLAHDFSGDCIVTNGLLLLAFMTGQTRICQLYLWDTSLGTPTWSLQGTIEYQDNAANAGTLRTIDLDRVGPEEVQLSLRSNTTAGNWSLVKLRLQRGMYVAPVEFRPLTESATNQLALLFRAQSAYVTAFTESTSQTVFPANLATTTTSGYGAVQGSASGSPIQGWLFQNIPTTAQGRPSSSTVFGYGDSLGPTVGSYERYAFFAVPYSGAVVLATARGIVAPLFQQFLFEKSARWVRG